MTNTVPRAFRGSVEVGRILPGGCAPAGAGVRYRDFLSLANRKVSVLTIERTGVQLSVGRMATLGDAFDISAPALRSIAFEGGILWLILP